MEFLITLGLVFLYFVIGSAIAGFSDRDRDVFAVFCADDPAGIVLIVLFWPIFVLVIITIVGLAGPVYLLGVVYKAARGKK